MVSLLTYPFIYNTSGSQSVTDFVKVIEDDSKNEHTYEHFTVTNCIVYMIFYIHYYTLPQLFLHTYTRTCRIIYSTVVYKRKISFHVFSLLFFFCCLLHLKSYYLSVEVYFSFCILNTSFMNIVCFITFILL